MSGGGYTEQLSITKEGRNKNRYLAKNTYKYHGIYNTIVSAWETITINTSTISSWTWTRACLPGGVRQCVVAANVALKCIRMDTLVPPHKSEDSKVRESKGS